MTVTGEAAKAFNAVRLDSLATINLGPLVEADEDTGRVAWKDKADQLQIVTLGPRLVKIIGAHR